MGIENYSGYFVDGGESKPNLFEKVDGVWVRRMYTRRVDRKDPKFVEVNGYFIWYDILKPSHTKNTNNDSHIGFTSTITGLDFGMSVNEYVDLCQNSTEHIFAENGIKGVLKPIEEDKLIPYLDLVNKAVKKKQKDLLSNV
jgi:hypothetical protein